MKQIDSKTLTILLYVWSTFAVSLACMILKSIMAW